jgi:hypothetical protein
MKMYIQIIVKMMKKRAYHPLELYAGILAHNRVTNISTYSFQISELA